MATDMYVSPRPLELLQPDDLFEEPGRDLPDYQDTTGSGGGGLYVGQIQYAQS